MQINDSMMKSSSKQSIRRSGLISLLCLIPLSILLNLLHSPQLTLCASKRASVYANANLSATNPLIYTRLRHDDNYLQIYRNLQLEHPHEEKEIELKASDNAGDSKHAKTVVYTYYENKQVSANLNRDDLILEALDRSYKSRIIPAYLYNYDNPDDRRKASDPSLISESKCRRDLWYLKMKLNNKHTDPIDPELAAFFDSFASEETGLLLGNYHWIGNWRQCYKRLVFDISNPSNVTHFQGRYCVASIRSKNWDQKIKEKTDQLLKDGNYFKYPEQQYDYARFFRIQLGICLPESCDSLTIDTQRELIRELTVHKLSEPLRSYQLVDLFCLPDETSELRQFSTSGLCLILLSGAWCSAIMMATLYDIKIQQASAARQKLEVAGSKATTTTLDKLVSAMSLLRNYQRLTETKSMAPPQPAGQADVQPKKLAPNDLLFLNAFKVISMPCIMFGHIGMLSIMLNRFTLDYEALGTGALNHFNISAVFFVDWYFVITGFLASYLTFVTKKIERSNLAQWIYTIFHRYWRLAPMYVLLFWFSKTLFKHTASGPVWDYGTNNMTIRSICQRESWLWPITLTPNFHPIHEECIMPAWYIANDMQFYIITPFILIGLSKKPILAWLATVGLINSSILARIIRYITDKRAQPLELMRPRNDAYMRNNWDMHPTYIEPQYRISSYLIGLLAGHYTYMVLTGQWRSPIYKYEQETTKGKRNHQQGSGETIRRILRCAACLFGFYVLIIMMFASGVISTYFPRSLEPQVKYFTAMVYGTSHSSTSLGLSLICVSLMCGQFPWLKRFLSHPIFTLMSRINFFIFLAQVEIIYWLFQSSERIVDLTPRDAFKNWILLSAVCYPLAALATLWLELPLANLEREFIGSLMHTSGKLQPARASNPKPSQDGKLIAGENNDSNERQNKDKNNGNDCELTSLTKDQTPERGLEKNKKKIVKGDSCEEVRID